MTDEARAVLAGYGFPGNVRELRHAIEHAAAMAGRQPIGPEHLPDAVARPAAPAEGATLAQWAEIMLDRVLASGDPSAYDQLIRRWERPVLEAAMARFDGNQARIAEALGMHRSTLRKRLRGYGLIAPDRRAIPEP